VEKDLANALMDFYQKMLKPEFDAIKEKLTEHDQRFLEMLGTWTLFITDWEVWEMSH
jgi:hypothetical protein